MGEGRGKAHCVWGGSGCRIGMGGLLVPCGGPRICNETNSTRVTSSCVCCQTEILGAREIDPPSCGDVGRRQRGSVRTMRNKRTRHRGVGGGRGQKREAVKAKSGRRKKKVMTRGRGRIRVAVLDGMNTISGESSKEQNVNWKVV